MISRLLSAWRRWLPFGSGVVSMLLVCSFRATAVPLNGDEGATLSVAARSLPQILDLATHVDAVITPYYLFVKIFVFLFGDGDLVLRLPSLIGVSLGVGVIAEIARRFWGTAAGVAAGMLCVTLPSLSHFGMLARPYGTVFFLASLATLLLFRALEQPTWRRWCAYGVVLMLAGLFHFVSMSLLAGHLVVIGTRWRASRDPRLLRSAAAIAGALSVLAPLAIIGMSQRDTQLFWLARPDFNTLRAIPADLVLNGAAAFLLIGLALAAAISFRGRTHRELLAIAGLPVVVVFVFAILVAPVWEARYAAFVIGPLAVLGGAALSNAATKATVIRITAAVAILVVMTLPDQQRIRTSDSASDPRTVASIILDHAEPGDTMAFGDGSWSTRATVSYYLQREAEPDQSIPDDVLLVRSAKDIGELSAVECDDLALCLAGRDRVWLVSTTSYDTDQPLSNGTTKMTTLGDCYLPDQSWPLPYARVTLLIRKPTCV